MMHVWLQQCLLTLNTLGSIMKIWLNLLPLIALPHMWKSIFCAHQNFMKNFNQLLGIQIQNLVVCVDINANN